jgi:hypothetical protein
MNEQNNGALAGKAASVAQGPASSKPEEWKAIDSTIGQLVLSQRAAHDLLVRKVETLHSQIRALLPKPPSKP